MCSKHAEYETKLHCVGFAQNKLSEIFDLLHIPVEEQEILIKTLNKEDTCLDSFKGELSRILRSKK